MSLVERNSSKSLARYPTGHPGYTANSALEQHPHDVSSGLSTGVFHKSKARDRCQSVGGEASCREFIPFRIGSPRSIPYSRGMSRKHKAHHVSQACCATWTVCFEKMIFLLNSTCADNRSISRFVPRPSQLLDMSSSATTRNWRRNCPSASIERGLRRPRLYFQFFFRTYCPICSFFGELP